MTSRSRRARFGPMWWDRYGHVSFYRPETGWVTYSQDGPGGDERTRAFEWPRPCRECDAITPEWKVAA